ncbi:MAG: hypothetical protein ACSLFQ_23600 [Thermoanaerobaculia bacterium]
MSKATCVVCNRDANTIPLLTLEFQSSTFNICPQHLPVLIHDPAQLIGRLPGAETFQPADHKD